MSHTNAKRRLFLVLAYSTSALMLAACTVLAALFPSESPPFAVALLITLPFIGAEAFISKRAHCALGTITMLLATSSFLILGTSFLFLESQGVMHLNAVMMYIISAFLLSLTALSIYWDAANYASTD